jgi:hypothetical protein
MGTGEVHTGFWWKNLKEGGHLEEPGVDGRYYYNGSSGSGTEGRALTGSIWLRNAVMNLEVS